MKMKKKIIAMLLFVVMLLPLFGVQAFAAKDYTPYITQVEVKQGDTLYSICKAKGMNYDEVKSAIMIVNGFSSDQKLNAIRPGQKLYIPNSSDAAKSILSLSNSTTTVVVPTDKVVQYTVKTGDTIFSICSAYKLDYTKAKEAIKELNGMTSDSQLGRIYAGQKLYLPISDTDAGSISTAVNKAADSNINVSKTTADKFQYYLVSYKMSSGETARSVADGLGIGYSEATAEVIKGVNGLTDLSRMQAGRSYLFPSSSVAGATYAVYSHVIASGDTAANLCAAYGLDYAKVSTILQGLNPKMNLGAIQTGRKILLVAASSGNGTPIQVSNGEKGTSAAAKGDLPVVTKNPTDESVAKGGTCFFVARYKNATWAVWHFVSPDGKTDLPYQDASKKFPSLKIINGMYSTMKLENVPEELNGWKVYCRYTNKAGSTDTASALITVKGVKAPAAELSADKLVGKWAEKIAGRGMITITKNNDGTYTAEVQWSGSAFEKAFWTMTGKEDGKGSILYTNALHYKRTFTSDTAYTDEILYKDGTGSFSLGAQGNLVWVDHKGDVKVDTVFIRAN